MLEEYDHNEKQWPRKKERKNAGCCSVSEFLLRSVLYFTAGILNAIGAGGMGSLNRKSNGCFYNQRHQDKDGNCDFILYTHISCCVLAWVLFLITVWNTCRNSFQRSRAISIEFILALCAFILMIAVTGVLTHNLAKFCKENDYSLDDCVHNLRRQEETLYRYILISGYGAWLATPTWLVLIIVLAVRCRRTTRANHHGSYDFDNPAQI